MSNTGKVYGKGTRGWCGACNRPTLSHAPGCGKASVGKRVLPGDGDKAETFQLEARIEGVDALAAFGVIASEKDYRTVFECDGHWFAINELDMRWASCMPGDLPQPVLLRLKLTCSGPATVERKHRAMEQIKAELRAPSIRWVLRAIEEPQAPIAPLSVNAPSAELYRDLHRAADEAIRGALIPASLAKPEPPPLKAGDLVRCRDGLGTLLMPGEVVEFIDAREVFDGQRVRVATLRERRVIELHLWSALSDVFERVTWSTEARQAAGLAPEPAHDDDPPRPHHHFKVHDLVRVIGGRLQYGDIFYVTAQETDLLSMRQRLTVAKDGREALNCPGEWFEPCVGPLPAGWLPSGWNRDGAVFERYYHESGAWVRGLGDGTVWAWARYGAREFMCLPREYKQSRLVAMAYALGYELDNDGGDWWASYHGTDLPGVWSKPDDLAAHLLNTHRKRALP